MAEYIDIDAQVVVTDTRGRERETTVRHIFEMNKGVYTVSDVVEVVRCKDCKEYAEWDDGMICLRFGSWYGNIKPEDYCSLGSMRGKDDGT